MPCNSDDYKAFIFFFDVSVDLEGIEPSSKRGNHKLSTCLSLPNFSSRSRTKAINSCLIL